MVIYEKSLRRLIIPDGLEGYTQADIDAAFQSGYTEGNADGYTDGYADGLDDGAEEQKSLLEPITITENGTYEREDGYSSILVNVASGETINNQVKSSNLTVNGTYIVTYDSGYTGLQRVDIAVNVPQTGHTDQEIEDAYNSGKTDQKSLLIATAVTANGIYSREDGYSSIDVNIAQTGHTDEELEDAYQSGYTSGETHQKSLLVSTAVTANGIYSREDGYSSINVNVVPNLENGKQVIYDKNGTYVIRPTSGYDGMENLYLVINVPTGYTQEELDAAYQSGLTVGYDSGYTSGYTDGYASGYTDGTAAKYISVVSSINFDLSGATQEVVIGSNTEWTVSTSDNWIAITPTSGFGNGTIEVTVDSGSTSREGSIVITSVDGQITKTIVIRQRNNEYLNQYLTFEIISGGTINWKHKDTDSKTIQYSINGDAWTNLVSSVSGDTVAVNDGDIVRFRGDNYTYGISSSQYHTFEGTTAIFNVYGNIMSLVDSENFSTMTTLPNNYMFVHLFGTTKIINANNLVLPATTLANSCYSGMFANCTLLTIAPELPATTLVDHCYGSMFQGCYSLTIAPELPATTLTSYCYSYMFNGCRSLTTAPVLPATTLAYGCYNGMFQECTSLVNAPELPATTLPRECYQYMFRGCTSLTTAPVLPSTILTTNCYREMFNGCTSLNYIKCLATDISANNCTYEWVNGTASSGTFIKNSNSNWERGDSGIPVGWTIQDAS